MTAASRRSLRLFALAAAPRLLYLLAAKPPFEGYHWAAASELLQYGILGDAQGKTTEFDPLYIAVLAAVRLLVGDHPFPIQVLQLAVDAAGAVGLYSLTATLTGRHRAALISAALYATYPLLIRYSVSCSESSLLSVLLITFSRAAVADATPFRTAAAGVSLGLAVLTRWAVAPLAMLMTGVFALTRGARTAGVFLLVVSAVASPWLLRNYAWNGSLWPTRSGVNLFVGNSRYTAAVLPEHNTDILGAYATELAERADPSLLNPASETALDRYYTMLTRDQVLAQPLYAVRLALSKAAYHFWPRLVPSRVLLPETRVQLLEDSQVRVEHSPSRPLHEELIYTVPYVFVLAAALFGIWSRRAHLRRDAVLWCIVCTFLAVSVAYFPATRFRVSMEFVLLFYAAVAIDRILPGARPATYAMRARR